MLIEGLPFGPMTANDSIPLRSCGCMSIRHETGVHGGESELGTELESGDSRGCMMAMAPREQS